MAELDRIFGPLAKSGVARGTEVLRDIDQWLETL
jgi:hypothetical protein